MQALMLAAGMGRRLGKYTEKCTKCMIKVGGRTLLERVVEALQLADIRKLIIVVGWEHEKLIQYIKENIPETHIKFEFIYNNDYATTNNIYSLYLAREQLAQDDTILLESDLVFDSKLLSQMVNSPERNLVAVAKYEQWMDGTVTVLSPDGTIQEFIEKKDFLFQNAENYYKTVNIYKFSKQFSCNQYIPFLKAYISAYGKNQYYELVLKALAHLSNANLKAFILNGLPWYEIDDIQDLDIANTIFSEEEDKLAQYERRYGGYWRFPGVTDFCYLVNPYFPPTKMLEHMKYFYEPLLTQYPSGMKVQKLVASKLFGVDDDYLLVGNGAAELIHGLGQILRGKLAISMPSFNEYVRCFKNCEIIKIPALKKDFCLDLDYFIQATQGADIVVIINPDNPSGNFWTQVEIIRILDHFLAQGVRCILDESFIDFAQQELRYTLLADDFLERYPNLIIIKSISKSYGVPGLRLGILATSDFKVMEQLKEQMSIWNINSFAEYFLQIYSLYQNDYATACNKVVAQRNQLKENLDKISFIKAYPSQANFIMCQVLKPYSAKQLATQLLVHQDLLIKDLSEKEGFEGKEFIRLAVKDQDENELLYKSLLSLDCCQESQLV